jgi:hypothetical protein
MVSFFVLVLVPVVGSEMVEKRRVVSTRFWCISRIPPLGLLMGAKATVVAAKHDRMHSKFLALIMVKVGVLPVLVPRFVIVVVRLVAPFYDR